jgi:uncharacterized GH25 family protein
MFFKCEIFNKEGKIIEERHIEVKVEDVSDAAKNEKVTTMRKKAQQQGFGFRVSKCE